MNTLQRETIYNIMPRRNRTSIVMTAIHIIGWGIMFGLPLLFSQNGDRSISLTWYGGYCAVPISFMTVFYVNYFGLIDRLLFRRKVVRYIVMNILLIAAVAILLHLWHDFFRQHLGDALPRPPKPGKAPVLVFMLRDSVMMALTAALSVAIRMTGNWYKSESQRQEAEKARTEAELQNLRSQLNPHFLFNTLNNIYALVDISPERAQGAIHELSRLLRHLLYEEDQAQVPLGQELEFVRSYIELMRLRMPATVTLKVEIDEAGNDRRIASLLFITLIENAFKHGVSATEISLIDIRIDCSDPGRIDCRIENSNHPKTDTDRSGSGIGLNNLRKRLILLYPGCYTLETGIEEDRYIARLTLEL